MTSPIGMPAVRETFKTIGALPFFLLGLGALLYWKKSRMWWLPAWAGVLWMFWNVLFSKREINATVTAGDATVTYPGE